MMAGRVRIPPIHRAAARRSGSALVIALFVASLLALFGSWLLTAVSRARDTAHLAHYRTQARLLAEAGIEKALGELSGGKAGYRGEQGTHFGKGELSVAVTAIGGKHSEREIVAQGIFPRVSATRQRRTLTVVAHQVGSTWSIARWIDETR